MKTKYAVTRDGEVLVESEDLDYIQRIKQEYEVRRTGRTTRMLFQALGDSSAEIAIVCFNRQQAKHLAEIMCDMFEKLKFPYLFDKSELQVRNFGKAYYFISEEQFRSIPRGQKNKYHRMTKYLDEK